MVQYNQGDKKEYNKGQTGSLSSKGTLHHGDNQWYQIQPRRQPRVQQGYNQGHNPGYNKGTTRVQRVGSSTGWSYHPAASNTAFSHLIPQTSVWGTWLYVGMKMFETSSKSYLWWLWWHCQWWRQPLMWGQEHFIGRCHPRATIGSE